MITYGHEKFIEKAINGVLMQECNFEIELILANDCSPDSTNEKVKHCIDSHPRGHWIKNTMHPKNLGMMPNFIWALEQCKGKYIALCEGDDYWTDPLKLQKQVDFLEANKEYSICFHRVKLFKQTEKKFYKDNITREVNETTIMADLAINNYVHTPSVVFRNNFELPEWFSKTPLGDWSLYMFLVRDKKIKKLNDIMAVYRVNEGGVWTNKSQIQKMEMAFKSFRMVYENVELNVEAATILEKKIKVLRKDIRKLKKSKFKRNIDMILKLVNHKFKSLIIR